jgi:RNA polymerase sigma-70 factor (ECF subfamily)
MEPLNALVVRAQQGDLEAYGGLMQATQSMVYAVALGVAREPGMAEDAAQEAYLRAFRRLGDLEEPAAFLSWLRRIVVTVALNMRRARRFTLLQLDDVPDVPVLDEAETRWSDLQRQRLAGALLTLTSQERRLCDRRYHRHWSTARLARDAGVDEPAMRKRLQRIRDKLRKEMEMVEQRGIRPEDIRPDFPAKVVELLARPQLTHLPENPVGRILELLRSVYCEFAEQTLPESSRTGSSGILAATPTSIPRLVSGMASSAWPCFATASMTFARSTWPASPSVGDVHHEDT